VSGGGLGAERKKLQLVLKTTVSSAHGATSPRTGSHPGPFTAGEKPDSYRRNYVHYVRSFVVSGKGGDGEDGEYEGGSPKAEWGSSSRREVVEIVVVVVRVRVV
jgi:hypothetical protein